jgi:hypothetical protein
MWSCSKELATQIGCLENVVQRKLDDVATENQNNAAHDGVSSAADGTHSSEHHHIGWYRIPLMSDDRCVDPMFKSREQQHGLLTYRLGCLLLNVIEYICVLGSREPTSILKASQ